jgi:hypothetical protein
MQPPDCPGWEYENHPQRATVHTRVEGILVNLRRGGLDPFLVAVDTRQVHLQIFVEVTPPGHDYYAGHYRGENFRCLRLYGVEIKGDIRVGAPPAGVAFLMQELNAQITAGITALDANVLLPARERLRYSLALACHALVAFFTIHPYANGNGHVGRLILWCILGRYGKWPVRWPVDPRPPDPPYSQLIVQHRNGDKLPLEQYVLQTLIP